jgi:enediyne biosynthesis protein E4
LRKTSLIFLFPLLYLLACKQGGEELPAQDPAEKIFSRLTPDVTGIHFSNDLEESESFDVFRYRNYYNGAGVAIGDINNDGLADVYFTANSTKNKLYLNQGNFHFKDITLTAGVGGTRAWSTGVSMVDVNADGLLDIYVCNSGDIAGDDKENELFINNGNLTFSERAKEFGLADQGFSTHAVFFDYDKDGDLDCYLLNNSFLPVSTLGYRNVRAERDKFGGDKLLRNDNGFFNDVSETAGIYGSVIGFGLGITVGDVNNDNWPDIYVSNDFFERDYLYINNRDGSFSERLESSIGHTSMFSMGADVADINNDGYLDIFSADMLPADDYRLKTITSFESYDVYQMKLKNGYYHQYMRNMLQLNNHDGTFSEIGQLAGVSATDWSWGALMADFNNDGSKEIFVCNGIYRDVTDQDFLEYVANEENVRAVLEGKKIDYQKVIKKMPSNKLINFMFTTDGEFHYKNVASSWGLDEPTFSNGSAYGDLDNDGDLDLVINNVNQESFVYRNESNKIKPDNHFLSISFKGRANNLFGLGARVEVYKGEEIIVQENMPIRGYQSSMDYKMILGVGPILKVDSMKVIWPDGKIQKLENVNVNQHIILDNKNAFQDATKTAARKLDPLLEKASVQILFKHDENDFNDFNNQRFVNQMLSTEGPALAVADLNNDKLDDFYVGGASGQAGKIFMQSTTGVFGLLPTKTFDADSVSEDVDAVFFDADNDGDLDLYVVSGGSEFAPASHSLQDRIYINKGSPRTPVFEKSEVALPEIRQVGSCVSMNDFDKDGDVDIFLGTRLAPSQYGLPCDSYLLENNGKGLFKIADQSALNDIGMVTDAIWFDYNHDAYEDLFIVGEWMPLTILTSNGKTLQKINLPELAYTEGWWNVVTSADIDHDGDPDMVLGNHGLNSKFKASKENPVSLYVNDFDKSGSWEQIFTYQKSKTDYPISLKQDLARQMNFLNKKFIYYKDYADKSIDQIFDEEMLENSKIQRVYELRSAILLNKGDGHFGFIPLPVQAQFGQIRAIEISDLDNDGIQDIALGGNMFSVKTDVGRYDALYGIVLKGNGKGNFKPVSSEASGLTVKGEIRNIKKLKGYKSDFLMVARNNDSILHFKIGKKGG